MISSITLCIVSAVVGYSIGGWLGAIVGWLASMAVNWASEAFDRFKRRL